MIDKRQQWFFLWLIAFWLFLAITAPIVAYCFTYSPLCFTGYIDIAPPAYLLYLLAKRIFPPGDNETKIAIEKHQKRARP